MKAPLSKDFAHANDNGPSQHKRPAYWNTSALEEWRAGHSEERRQDDARLLARLAEIAENVPALRETMEWARATGLEFVIDRSLKNDGAYMAAGYYTPGSGVVAIAAWCFAREEDIVQAIATAVHETRHAWQEVQKLAPNVSPSFEDYTLRLSAVEADATAHEKLAMRQYEDFRAGKPATNADVKKEMWGYFRDWYGTQGPYYVALAESTFADAFGLPASAAGQPSYGEIAFEFTPTPPEDIAFPGVDISRPEQFRRLSRTYGGAHYFDAADKDFMQRQVLSPGRAAARFTDGPPDAIAQQIRRCELRQKFAGRKMRCPKM